MDNRVIQMLLGAAGLVTGIYGLILLIKIRSMLQTSEKEVLSDAEAASIKDIVIHAKRCALISFATCILLFLAHIVNFFMLH